MKRSYTLRYALTFVLLAFGFGCVASQIQGGQVDSVKTCIQGKVWLKSPINSKEVARSGVSVNVWRHEKIPALAETKNIRDGK